MSKALENRYEFVLLFDVENGNPNGDPDAGNMPRVDPETNVGIITDVCLKRKIRNVITMTQDGKQGYEIFVQEKGILNQQIERAYAESDDVKGALEAWQLWQKNKKKGSRPPKHYEDVAKDWMCCNFFDIRAFGAVMSTGDAKDDGENSKVRMTAGQVRGPIQLAFAKSVEPIVSREISITRMAVTNEKDLEKERTIGKKSIVAYGLYRVEGYISAYLAEQTGFSEDDLALLWQALANMFDHDHSAARGTMSAHALVAFKHDSIMGNAPAHTLLSRLKVTREASDKPARAYTDYTVSLDEANMPKGVTIQKLLWT